MAIWLRKWGTATVLTSAVLLGIPGGALAQSDAERAGARAAAEAGLSAFNAGRYAEAQDLLGRAESLVHALPHLLYMARASEKLGQLVQARELYLKISREQLIAGAPRAFIDAQAAATQELALVESRLPYLTVVIEGARPNDVKVTMDEREIPGVLLGVPFPVDPGSHTVQVTGTLGQRGEPVKVALSEGKRERITLKLGNPPPLQPTGARPSNTFGTAAQPVAAAPTSTGAAPASVDHGVKDQPSNKSPSILAWGTLGVGVVGAAVGTIFIIQRGSKQSDADAAFNDCKTRYCGPSEVDKFKQLDKDAATAGTISLVGFGVGAVALTASIYLLLSGNSKPAVSLQDPKVKPYFGPNTVGATLRF